MIPGYPGRRPPWYELNDNALEDIFSNRDVKFGGWDAGLAALSRDIDPTGAYGIARGPRPQPVHPDLVITEGSASAWLITFDGGGRGVGSVARGKPGARGWQADGHPQAVAEAIIQTLARINKYGEPSFHLRDHLLRTGRYIIEDLSLVPLDVAHRDKRALNVLAYSSNARSVLLSTIGMASPEVLARRAALPQRTEAAGTLALDDLDIANAALDLLRATDSSGRTTGTYTPRDDYDAEHVVQNLLSVADGRPIFGGKSAPGSREDAVACKAFETLVWIAQYDKPHAELFRSALLGVIGREIPIAALPEGNLPRLRAARSALALAGVATPQEANELHHTMFEYLTAWSIEPRWLAESIRTEKVLLKGMRGPAAGVFRSAFDAEFARIQDVVRSPAEKTFLDQWNTVPLDPATASTVAGPCAATPGEPRGRIFLFAVCADGLQPIDQLVAGVPTVIEAQFESPLEKDEVTLDVAAGSSTKMTAKKVDPMGRIFRTDPFLPGGAQ